MGWVYSVVRGDVTWGTWVYSVVRCDVTWGGCTVW